MLGDLFGRVHWGRGLWICLFTILQALVDRWHEKQLAALIPWASRISSAFVSYTLKWWFPFNMSNFRMDIQLPGLDIGLLEWPCAFALNHFTDIRKFAMPTAARLVWQMIIRDHVVAACLTRLIATYTWSGWFEAMPSANVGDGPSLIVFRTNSLLVICWLQVLSEVVNYDMLEDWIPNGGSKRPPAKNLYDCCPTRTKIDP